MRALVVAAAVIACFACAAPPAAARTVTSHAGGVDATLRYHMRDTFYPVLERLKIARNGETLVNRKPRPRACRPYTCQPTIGFGAKAVIARDLDAHGEPEVVYNSYWGGAHCCFIAQVYRYDPGRGRYRTTSRNFGDLSYNLRDLERDGRVEWMSADQRVAYAFASFAFSGFPIRIWHFRHGRFIDVTKQYPGRIRRDGHRHWRAYRRLRHRRDGEQRGVVAAWAGDRYLLGKRRQARRVLRREVRRGHLDGYNWDGRTSGRRFVRRLDRFLRKRGY